MSIRVKINTPMDAYKVWLMNRRFNEYVKTWNGDVVLIQGIAETTQRQFYWLQLIRQEIEMYIKLGEAVKISEFEELCKRRGFTPTEAGYLKVLLEKVGLWGGK